MQATETENTLSRTRIRAHAVFSGDAVISPGAVVLDGALVEAVGDPAAIERLGPFDDERGDSERDLVFPGFVNGHHHSLRPNRPRRVESPLELNLLQMRRRRLPSLTPEEEYDHTLWGAMALLRTGVTTVVDCFPADPKLSDLGLTASLDAFVDAGIRVAVCVRCSDRANFTYEDDEAFWSRLPDDVSDASRAKTRPFDADGFFEKVEGIARTYDGRDDRIRIGYGPTGDQWCSDALLQRIRDVTDERQAPVQIHLLESPFQRAAAELHYGASAVAHLRDLGFIGPRFSFAHGIWVSRDDIGIIRDGGSTIINNPGSNLWAADGIAPVATMIAMGARVGLGLDANGFEGTFDTFREMRLALLLQRSPGWNRDQVSYQDVLGMATSGGARAAGMPVQVGRLEPGGAADLVIVDRNELARSPYLETDRPLPESIVTSASPEAIRMVVVAGRVVMERGDIWQATFDATSARVRDSLDRFVPLLEEADAEFRALEPYVDEAFRSLDLGAYGIPEGARNLGP